MKKILIFFLITISLIASEKKQKLTIGLGLYTQTQPYKDADAIMLPSPVVFYDDGLFYVRWSRVGVYFLGEKKDDYLWGFSLTAQPRTLGYKSKDTKYLKGLDEKKNTFEGGLAFSGMYKSYYIEIMALEDLLGRYNSWVIRGELGYDKIKIGDFSFYPSIVLLYQSSKLINYYYGISLDDAKSSGYKRYSANNGLEVGVQTYIKYPLTKKLSTLINIRLDKLSSEATNSPIVHDNYIFSSLVSLIYTFEY
jgi:outer membrane protein